MKKTKFNEEQITMALHIADQTSVEEVMRKLGIASRTASVVLAHPCNIWPISPPSMVKPYKIHHYKPGLNN